ncbi:MAG: hypothetical protein JXR36_01450 [Bacteroidales bacterium]|nr:hypothetical protein [Bacteroidales bacterium]
MKKRILNFALAAAILLFTFGCSIKQEIYFNKDFSGKYKYTYDFSEYVSYMGEEEDSDSLMMKNEDFEEYLNTVVTELKKIEGINNVKYLNDADHGLVYFQYDFDNVNALNKGLVFSSYMDQEPMENPPYFEVKGKKLTFIRHATPVEEATEETTTEDTDYMNDMFAWEFTLEFEANVKKYDVQKDTAITVSGDKRKFVETGNVFDVAEKETKWVFKTK